MMPTNPATTTTKVVSREMYQPNGSPVPSSDYCLVSVSSIKDLFSKDFVNTYPLLPMSSDTVSAEKHRILPSQRHEGIHQYRKRYQNVPSAKNSTVTKHLGESKATRTSDRLHSRNMLRMENEKIHTSNAPQLNNMPGLYHENKIQHLQEKINNILHHPISSADTYIPRSSTRRRSSDQLLSRKEFLFIQNALNQMEEEVQSFEKKLMDYLSGKSSTLLKLKHSLTMMLGTSEENFDQLITSYYLMDGGGSLKKHQARFRKRLGEFYRVLLICKYYGFIGLQCSNRHNSEVSICGNEGKLMAHPSSPSSDENSRVAKLRVEFEDASLELQRINERIYSGIQWIHTQCPSVRKREESHLMCVKLGLNITERVRKSRSSKATTRAFVTWKLESLLRHNRLKVLSFKTILSQCIFYKVLTAKRAQMLKLRFNRWRIFLKLKRREERIASTIQLQRTWRAWAGRKSLRTVRIELLALKLQSTARVYRLRHLLRDLRIELRKSHAAINLQKVSRQFLALQRYETMVQINRKTVQLQRFVRLSMAKNDLFIKRRQKIRYQILTSTILLQKHLRRLSSVRIKNDLKLTRNVTLMQCLWRRFDGRKTSMIVKVAVTIQKLARRLLSKKDREKTMFVLVVRIQNTIRSYSARAIRIAMHKSSARQKIQSFMAIVLTRKVVQRKVKDDSARVLQRCMTRYRMKIMQHQQDLSTMCIQSMYRLRAARALLKQQTKAKNRVFLLLHLQRRKLLHGSIFTLQNRVRMMQAINKINRIQRIRLLATALQKRYRCLSAKRCLERMSAFDRNCRHSAANKIQLFFCRFLRWKLKQISICKQKDMASIVMQQYIRRMISMKIKQTIQLDKKKLFASHYVSATKIQSGCRSYFAREALTEIREWKYRELEQQLKAWLSSQIQSYYRLKLAKTYSYMLRQQRRTLMALRIQSFIRNRLAKRILLELTRESDANRTENVKCASVVTQKWWRVVVTKNRLRQTLSKVRSLRKHSSFPERLINQAQEQDKRASPKESSLDKETNVEQRSHTISGLIWHVQDGIVKNTPANSPELSGRQGNSASTLPLILQETFKERDDTSCSSISRSENPRIGDWLEQFMNDVKSSTSYNEISDKGAVSDQVSGQIMNKGYTSEKKYFCVMTISFFKSL